MHQHSLLHDISALPIVYQPTTKDKPCRPNADKPRQQAETNSLQPHGAHLYPHDTMTRSAKFSEAPHMHICSHSRARALLAYASQVFLVCPIGILTIFMCLRGYADDAVIGGRAPRVRALPVRRRGIHSVRWLLAPEHLRSVHWCSVHGD
ncbi:hypothetical protein BBP40_008470 [Aspergillus hancockii]|nr:hypothetical protein BBP40_008470 [Aspergillus hancockii]